MTPKRDEFEEKLEDILEQTPYGWRNAVTHGARWAREQTIKEVLEALRSDEAADALFMWVGHASPSSAADWLEQRLKGKK